MGLFLNGNKTNNPYQHFENARIVLRNYCGSYGEINECNYNLRNGIMIDRNSTTYNNLYEVLRQISYLAKKTQKDNVPGKTFFYSKVPILPLSNEDITRAFQSLFPYLTFGTTNWYATWILQDWNLVSGELLKLNRPETCCWKHGIFFAKTCDYMFENIAFGDILLWVGHQVLPKYAQGVLSFC